MENDTMKTQRDELLAIIADIHDKANRSLDRRLDRAYALSRVYDLASGVLRDQEKGKYAQVLPSCL